MSERTLSGMFRIFAHSGQIQGYRLMGQRSGKVVSEVVVFAVGLLIGLYVGWALWG